MCTGPGPGPGPGRQALRVRASLERAPSPPCPPTADRRRPLPPHCHVLGCCWAALTTPSLCSPPRTRLCPASPRLALPTFEEHAMRHANDWNTAPFAHRTLPCPSPVTAGRAPVAPSVICQCQHDAANGRYRSRRRLPAPLHLPAAATISLAPSCAPPVARLLVPRSP